MQSLRLAFNCSAWLPTSSEWAIAGRCIQPEERERISQFHFKNDAKLCLIGRLLLRYAITSCTDIKWADLTLIRDSKSKPLLDSKHDARVSFNASHQGDYVVVVTDNVQVGVDVMDVRERHGENEKFFKLMNRHFTEQEWKEIESSNDRDLQMHSFYRHWCLKESFVKAIGKGIGYSLLSLNFATRTPLTSNAVVTDTVLYHKGHLDSDWLFEESLVGGSHIVAVARNSNVPSASKIFEELTFDRVMEKAETLCDRSEVDENFLNCFDNPYKTKKLS